MFLEVVMNLIYLGIGAGVLWLFSREKKVEPPRYGIDYDMGRVTKDFDVDSKGKVNSDFEREFLNNGELDIDVIAATLRNNDVSAVNTAVIEVIEEINNDGQDISSEEFLNRVQGRLCGG